MYNILKKLMPVAEEIGKPAKVRVYENEEYYDDSVKISGVTNDGKHFELEITVKETGNGNS